VAKNKMEEQYMKFFCRCGNLVRDQLIPNPISFRIVSDIVLHETGDLIDLNKFCDRSSQILQCDRCGRLWIWWKNKSTYFEEYLPLGAESESTGCPRSEEEKET
jgi:hypothetical protein